MLRALSIRGATSAPYSSATRPTSFPLTEKTASPARRPARLVSLHSSIQGWYAGDILSTGTPRAFEINDGDMAECRIYGPDGFEMEPLVNPVVDLKKHPEKA